jgi:hypothetical protein
MVPGAKRSYPGAISGLFTSHHPIPPPARDAEFSINGAFARGEDECRLGREGEVRWALHADR